MSKYRVYTISATSDKYRQVVQQYSDLEFKEVSRKEGGNYGLKAFQETFNSDRKFSDDKVIRIIKVD